MIPWSQDELSKIADADDLHISPFRADGMTYGTPTRIWSVAVEGALYVRAYRGQDSRWYRAAVMHEAGRITAAGMTKDVGFEPVATEGARIHELVDDAYRAKYHESAYLGAMIGTLARCATLKVMPRESKDQR